jgi:hypothetical protein
MTGLVALELGDPFLDARDLHLQPDALAAHRPHEGEAPVQLGELVARGFERLIRHVGDDLTRPHE